MSVVDRPFIGSWKLGSQKLVQVTPDCLVFVNGDLALPGCQRCHSRIDLQRFITEVSVDAGCDAGAASASFSLGIPAHHRDSFVRDAQFILRAGLEVHVYMRGYFPVKGLYSNLAQPATMATSTAVGLSNVDTGVDADQDDEGMAILDPTDSAKMDPADWKDRYESTFRKVATERYPDQTDQDRFVAQSLIWSYNESGGRTSREFMLFGQKKGSAGAEGYNGRSIPTHEFRQKDAPDGSYKKGDKYPTPANFADFPTAYEATVAHAKWQEHYPDGVEFAARYRNFPTEKHPGLKGFVTLRSEMGISQTTDGRTGKNLYVLPDKDGVKQSRATRGSVDSTSPSTLEEMGLGGHDIENVLAYPYYHVFHGVVTQVTHSYSSGTNTASVQCASMLHFWQYQQMSTNASVFGARPPNSGNRISMVGHNFTGKHPYEIMYTLHHDTAGAAGGVAWAISQKTNQTATSDLTSESLYSLNIKYWQKRFSLRDIKLRMHGVSGEMFNSVQAAFLSRMSSTNLMSLIRGRYNNSGTSKAKEIFSQAMSVGLYNKRRLEALVQARNKRGPEGNKSSPTLEINMAEMVAFVSDVAQWGQIQLFESTYESKLDIAQKVCEVTGFEFYQDVDGDFVFKPPMYNLDTSSSRVYRIEDIDIISINFEDKEPQVTYMTCKGSHFENVKVGIDNEMGVQGQYIDYRLVAQFGWRPGNFESSYFTDPKSMFFAAVNRLDIMNAPTRSASVTIPIRPELRPGYPVYIPYLDAFYYCNSFAHSFSVGSGCTTSLQLIGKRSKFFAPGHPGQRGIESIDLGTTLLPEKPLEVLDNNGRPRMSGFPNVVMALDPSQIDPLFFVVGSDIEKIDDTLTLEFLMKKAMDMSIVTAYPDPTRPGPYYYMKTGSGDGDKLWFKFKTDNSVDDGKIDNKPTKYVDVKKQATQLVYNQNSNGKKLANRKSKVERLNQVAINAQKKATDLSNKAANSEDGSKAAHAADVATHTAETKAKTATKELDAWNNLRDSLNGNLSEKDHSDLASFRRLLKDVTETFQRPDTFQSQYEGDPNSSITILEMLADKKAVFSTKSLPGSYRYYSSAHPDAKHQGQDLLTITISKEANTQAKRVVTTPSFLSPLWQQFPCPTYINNPTTSQDGLKPEAELADRIPKRGMMVFTNNKNFAAGEVLPTSEITELMFASHQVFRDSSKHSKEYVNAAVVSGIDFVQAWQDSAENGKTGVGTPDPTSTLTKAMSGWVTGQRKIIDDAVEAAKKQIFLLTAQKVPKFPDIGTPGFVTFLGGQVNCEVPLDHYRFAGDKAEDESKPLAWPDSSSMAIKNAWFNLARQYGANYLNAFLLAEDAWVNSMLANEIPPEIVEHVVSAFNSIVGGGTGVKKSTSIPRVKTHQAKTVKGKKGKAGNGSVLVPTPVFPISDARGYTVIGSYKYGRGVTIDPDGVFDVLHRQDIFSMLDKNTIDQVLNVFVRNQQIYADVEAVINGKKVIKKTPLHGPAARSYLQGEVLKMLSKNYSQQDLINMGKARLTSDSQGGTVLEVNMANWIANEKDGITKLPVINAAFSLADLAPHTSRDFCSCKAAEASVLLDIAGTREFVQFTEAGKPNNGNTAGDASVDRTVQWVKQTTAAASIPWVQSQVALRGSVPNQGPTSIISAASGIVDSLSQSDANLDVKRAAFEASKKALADLQKKKDGQ